jgi:hypothetical protein
MDKITVTYGKLKKIMKQLRQMNFQDSDEVSFEFIIGSCFPDIYNNIQEEMRRQHAMGYAEGLKKDKN